MAFGDQRSDGGDNAWSEPKDAEDSRTRPRGRAVIHDAAMMAAPAASEDE